MNYCKITLSTEGKKRDGRLQKRNYQIIKAYK